LIKKTIFVVRRRPSRAGKRDAPRRYRKGGYLESASAPHPHAKQPDAVGEKISGKRTEIAVGILKERGKMSGRRGGDEVLPHQSAGEEPQLSDHQELFGKGRGVNYGKARQKRLKPVYQSRYKAEQGKGDSGLEVQ